MKYDDRNSIREEVLVSSVEKLTNNQSESKVQVNGKKARCHRPKRS